MESKMKEKQSVRKKRFWAPQLARTSSLTSSHRLLVSPNCPSG
ncbi:hypothetical protein CCACVL1_29832 [Corchorus capsularis]|uniref:Uncharacterized protein n=1 Tax=Corchorus capsularis TaxID=210143 RepID=A0A1R3FZV0_COCAP|nr:hypothetical protein CCACVL1_29832 [Corchorus capsularis]